VAFDQFGQSQAQYGTVADGYVSHHCTFADCGQMIFGGLIEMYLCRSHS